MSSSTAAALLLFLVGGFIGIFFLIARSKPEQQDLGGQRTSGRRMSKEVGDTVLLAMAVIGLFGSFVGLLLLARDLG